MLPRLTPDPTWLVQYLANALKGGGGLVRGIKGVNHRDDCDYFDSCRGYLCYVHISYTYIYTRLLRPPNHPRT